MKKILRKAMTLAGSAALIGMTIGGAVASAYPDPFTSNTAIVVGANAAPSDNIAASSIASNLDANSAGTSVTTLTGAEGVTEDQVSLQGHLVTGKITSSLTDSKIPTLIDEKISWDDGGASGSDDYNVHEEIRVGAMAINTSLDDNDYEEMFAMTNDKAFEYRYVFETAFNITGVGDSDADDLYLTLLGKQYEIDAMTANSITVVTSEEVSLSIGESTTINGKTFTVDDVFSSDVQVNGELISTGNTKKIDGMRVKVKSIGYHSNAPELSKVILQIGEDISKTYTSGQAFVGEDEDDPNWIWTFSDPSVANGYIGVKYNQKETRDSDNVVFVGGSYILPNNYAAVTFDGTTDGIKYTDYKVYFDQLDLWNSTDLTSTEQVSDAYVLVIEATDGANDAIKLTNATAYGNQVETDKIYLRIAEAGAGGQTATFASGINNSDTTTLEVYFADVDNTVDEAIKPRYLESYALTSNTTLVATDIGDLIFGDSIIPMTINVTAAGMNLTFTDEADQNVTLVTGGETISVSTGAFKWFGGNTEATDKEDGLTGDMNVGGILVGTYDNDIITKYGMIVETPETNLDDDVVMISVPDDRVYAIVSVVAGGDATTSTDAGVMTVTDANVASAAGKNLIVVGGSAINSVAAELLGGAYSEAAFTSATDVAAGEFLIQSFSRSGKTALLVAGYNAADTEKAVTYLLNNDVDTSVGTKMKGTSATEATVVTA